MSDSLIIDFLNENQYRAYPLKNSGTRAFQTSLLLDTIILDANLIYHGNSPGNAVVNFTSITLSGGNATVYLAQVGTFVVPSYQTAVYPYYCRISNGSLLVFGQDLALVNTNVSFSDVEFEPSVVVAFDSVWSGVTSLSFNGTQVAADVITFEAGFQFKIEASEITDVITFRAGLNYGTPIGCETYFPGVAKDCGSIISFINGVGVSNNGASLSLTGGSNIAIYNDAENHRVYVGLNFQVPDVCTSSNNRPSPNIL